MCIISDSMDDFYTYSIVHNVSLVLFFFNSFQQFVTHVLCNAFSFVFILSGFKGLYIFFNWKILPKMYSVPFNSHCSATSVTRMVYNLFLGARMLWILSDLFNFFLLFCVSICIASITQLSFTTILAFYLLSAFKFIFSILSFLNII